MIKNIFTTIILSISSLLFADPGWIDDPNAYEFTATMNAQILQDGGPISESGDVLAAFDADGNVRGVSTEQTGIGPVDGQIVHEIILRSNDGGDVLTFRYYDVSEDVVLNIQETYEFLINDLSGTLLAPHPLNIALCENCPNWEDDPNAYEFTATMNAQILQDGGPISESGDVLAAFDADGNVRGVSTEQTGIGPVDGQIIHEIILRSNDGGDVLTFQYYDASEDVVLNIQETYEFLINDLSGTLLAPHPLNIGSGEEECLDDDEATAPVGGCAAAVAAFGCDFVWGGSPLSEVCPVSCDACPGDEEECLDDDEATAPAIIPSASSQATIIIAR